MKLKLKSKKILKKIVWITLLLMAAVSVLFASYEIAWNSLDYKVSDIYYTHMVDKGRGVKISDRIAYVTISDKTYDMLKSNILSRKLMAELNNSMARFSPAGVMYDIVFARPNSDSGDSLFAESISNLGVVWLPTGFALQQQPCKFRWESGRFSERLKNEYLKRPKTIGNGWPLYARDCLSQSGLFAQRAAGSGHITSITDQDGATRHFNLIIKVDSMYFPTVSLAMFLDYVKVPFDSVTIEWGRSLIIPALKQSYLEKEVVVPIDKSGRVYVPFPYRWENIPKMLEVQNVIKYASQEKYAGELSRIFEGSFVYVGDVSVGISDLGQTSIESNVPLVEVHAALMNALLQNQFYSEEKGPLVLCLILAAGLILLVSSFPRSNLCLYLANAVVIIIAAGYAYYDAINFRLFPLVTVIGGAQLFFVALVLSIQYLQSNEQYFIKGAFAKYVPEKVVEHLLANPEELKLGGDERFLTIMFTDIAGFTQISESLAPTKLVPFLNEYLTKMTDIVLQNGGIIDKYLGDGIIAEFGAPLPLANHADHAVSAGLKMLETLEELGNEWELRGLPRLRCRVGINSGDVIVGNMGSAQVFDYTVIGDAVNLASRLESASKQYGSRFLISESTFRLLTPNKYRTRVLDIIKVKGKSQAVKVYEVIGYSDFQTTAVESSYFEKYAEGFELYLARDFIGSAEAFKRSLEFRPADIAAVEMLRRSMHYCSVPPPETWDGSAALTEK